MDVIKKRRTVFFVFLLIFLALIVALFLNSNFGFDNSKSDGYSGIDVDNGDSKVNWSKYKSFNYELTDSLEITESGTYYLSGVINDGSITVDVGDLDGVVRLVLQGIDVECSNGPAIYVKSADDIVIETAEGTSNSFVSGLIFDDFGDENVNGTIYSKGDLSFGGNGYLYVESNYQDAIVGKDDLTIRSGEIEISAVDDGIRGKDSVSIFGGKIDINAKQDAIKSTNEEDSSKGFVYIEDGEINISAGDDGIHATTNLIIDGGSVDISKSYEGLEAAKAVINGGSISINSNDDGINIAGGEDESAFMRPGAEKFSSNVEYNLTINDGDIYINSTGDGLDSNGVIYINGGKIVVDGPINSANGALDSELGISFNGGSVVAVGASGMAESFTDSSSGFGISIYFSETMPKRTNITVFDSDGNKIIGHTSEKTFGHVVFGSEKFEFGKTYKIYVNDEEYETVTISQTVSAIGNASFNNGMDGDMGGQGRSTPPSGRF